MNVPSKEIVFDISSNIDTISEILKSGGVFPLKVTGNSMTPFFRDGKHIVFIEEFREHLKINDIALFYVINRADEKKHAVLHRVSKVSIQNGMYIYDFCGDNNSTYENGVSEKQIIGIVNRFSDGKKEHSRNDFSVKVLLGFVIARRYLRKILVRLRLR